MTSKNQNVKSGINKDVLWVVVGLISIIFVCVFFIFGIADFAQWIQGDQASNSSGQAAADVYKRLEQLPTEPWFYALLVVLFGVYLASKWYRYDRLVKEFDSKEKEDDAENQSSLTRHDWWTARELRKRAFVLRTQAILILASVFVLLLGGVYLVLFVLLEAGITDELITKKREFENRFGQSLDAIVNGRYWFKMAESDKEKAKSILNKNADVSWVAEASLSTTQDGRQTWHRSSVPLQDGEYVSRATLSADGKTGLVAGRKGSVFVTRDGGQHWTRLSVVLEHEKKITVAILSANGKTGLVAGHSSVFMTTDGGQTWHRSSVPVQDEAYVIMATLSADGKTGLAAGNDSSVFMTTDGGQTWHRSSVPVQDEGFFIVATLSADGKTGLVAGERLVFMTTDGGQTWHQSSVPVQDEGYVNVATLSADGKTGLAAGFHGSVFRTTDGGQTWHQLSVPVKDAGWVAAVKLGADGNIQPLVFLTIQTRVSLSKHGGQNLVPSSLLLQRGEFIVGATLSADGKTGLVGKVGGAVFLTKDGGQTWH